MKHHNYFNESLNIIAYCFIFHLKCCVIQQPNHAAGNVISKRGTLHGHDTGTLHQIIYSKCGFEQRSWRVKEKEGEVWKQVGHQRH